MIAAMKYKAEDLFRLAWAQERLSRLRAREPDINRTSVKPIAAQRCVQLAGVDQMTLREAVECMQETIRIELERN
jgi:hypothetical protein